MKKRILIIDDDNELNSLLTDFLSEYDYEVITANQPGIGLELIKIKSPDLIVLDVMMPEKNGFEVCKEIREFTQTPIIMLSARQELDDKIVGLELGADDYMPKPYDPRELMARIQSVLRRTTTQINSAINHTIKSHELMVDTQKATASLNNIKLDLTTMEFEILSLFMKNPGTTLSREQIVDKIRGIEWDSIDRTIDVIISRLRQKLKDDAKNPKYLKTIWGSGYRFVGEIIE